MTKANGGIEIDDNDRTATAPWNHRDDDAEEHDRRQV